MQSTIYNLFVQEARNVAGVEQPDLSMGWRKVHRHLPRQSQDPDIAVEREKPSDEATLVPDGGHRLSLPDHVFCSQQCPRVVLNHLQKMLRRSVQFQWSATYHSPQSLSLPVRSTREMDSC